MGPIRTEKYKKRNHNESFTHAKISHQTVGCASPCLVLGSFGTSRVRHHLTLKIFLGKKKKIPIVEGAVLSPSHIMVCLIRKFLVLTVYHALSCILAYMTMSTKSQNKTVLPWANNTKTWGIQDDKKVQPDKAFCYKLLEDTRRIKLKKRMNLFIELGFGFTSSRNKKAKIHHLYYSTRMYFRVTLAMT